MLALVTLFALAERIMKAHHVLINQFVMVLSLLGVVLSPQARAVAQETKGLYARAEVRGQLLPGVQGAGSGPASPTIEANGLTFTLSGESVTASADELRAAYHKVVVARGLLSKRADEAGKEHLVLKLEGKLEVVGSLNYLIGYHNGEGPAAEAQCKELGLKIIENYAPGKYLKVEPTDQTRHGFLKHLRENKKSVRYIEANLRVRAQNAQGR